MRRSDACNAARESSRLFIPFEPTTRPRDRLNRTKGVEAASRPSATPRCMRLVSLRVFAAAPLPRRRRFRRRGRAPRQVDLFARRRRERRRPARRRPRRRTNRGGDIAVDSFEVVRIRGGSSSVESVKQPRARARVPRVATASCVGESRANVARERLGRVRTPVQARRRGRGRSQPRREVRARHARARGGGAPCGRRVLSLKVRCTPPPPLPTRPGRRGRAQGCCTRARPRRSLRRSAPRVVDPVGSPPT